MLVIIEGVTEDPVELTLVQVPTNDSECCANCDRGLCGLFAVECAQPGSRVYDTMRCLPCLHESHGTMEEITQ